MKPGGRLGCGRTKSGKRPQSLNAGPPTEPNEHHCGKAAQLPLGLSVTPRHCILCCQTSKLQPRVIPPTLSLLLSRQTCLATVSCLSLFLSPLSVCQQPLFALLKIPQTLILPFHNSSLYLSVFVCLYIYHHSPQLNRIHNHG